MRNKIPNRKRKRLRAERIDERCIDRLKITQTEIGWDNLLCGKLAKGWRVCQHEYEAMKTKERKDRKDKTRSKNRNITNPYDKENDKKEPKKKKKKEKDVFQHLIERIFVIAEEEIWIQRNRDRHQPNHKNSYTEVIKVDREIRKLYGQSDEVRLADREDIYSIDLEQKLSQPMNEKRRWIIRWRATIQSSIKRNKREAATANPIWSYYNCTKEPKKTIDIIAQRRNKKHKIDLKRQRSTPLRDIKAMPGYTVIRKKRSTSRRKHQPLQPPKFKKDQPSVAEHFQKKDPADHFGDAGND